MFVMYGHVLHRLHEHLNVPGSSSVDKEPLTRELRRLLSRLNETVVFRKLWRYQDRIEVI